ncbi:MAG TPA: hypothetical protein VG711_01350 [Phycisphaerales bacterium]|nr:hypothetical protein [Phycisphaerales bacterium]
MSDDCVHLEIERKYLLSGVPSIPQGAEVLRIEQGYMGGDSAGMSIRPGRLRRITHRDGRVQHIHTIKQGDGLVRVEQEREISKEEFETWWPSTLGRRLTKVRHRVPSGDVVWEIDVFEKLGVVLAEVELADANEQVDIPRWVADCLVREVTDEPAFRNSELACRAEAARDGTANLGF